MSSTIPNIHELTKQIEERIKASRPSHLLYNPSDEFVEVMINGSPITIPPDGRVMGEDGQWKTYDGTLSIQDVFGVDPVALREARQKGIKRPNLPSNKVILSALDAVAHVVRKRYLRGVCFLTGHVIEDAKIKAQAKRTWVEWRKEQAERSIAAYRQQTAAFHADARNQGQPAPPMPEHVQEAQEFLDEYRLGAFNRKRFGCPVNCGYYTDDQGKLDTHIRASHPLVHIPHQAQTTEAPEDAPQDEPAPPGTTQEPEGDPTPEEGDSEASADQPVRRRPGRPPKYTYTLPGGGTR